MTVARHEPLLKIRSPIFVATCFTSSESVRDADKRLYYKAYLAELTSVTNIGIEVKKEKRIADMQRANLQTHLLRNFYKRFGKFV